MNEFDEITGLKKEHLDKISAVVDVYKRQPKVVDTILDVVE